MKHSGRASVFITGQRARRISEHKGGTMARIETILTARWPGTTAQQPHACASRWTAVPDLHAGIELGPTATRHTHGTMAGDRREHKSSRAKVRHNDAITGTKMNPMARWPGITEQQGESRSGLTLG